MTTKFQYQNESKDFKTQFFKTEDIKIDIKTISKGFKTQFFKTEE
jgi:hypothetical protein